MSTRVMVLLKLPSSCHPNCLPDCECKETYPERMETLTNYLAKYLTERVSNESSKGSSVRGSAVYLNPPKH